MARWRNGGPDDTWAPSDSNLVYGYAWWLWPVHLAVGAGLVVFAVVTSVNHGPGALVLLVPATVFGSVGAYELRDARRRRQAERSP